MLTLPSALATAQSYQQRKPLVEIISSSPVEAIPFHGYYLTSGENQERGPNIVLHSDGRWAMVYVDSGRYIKLSYTDVDRYEWTVVTAIDLGISRTATEVSVTELENGNLGLVWTDRASSTHTYLRRAVISRTGEVVSAPADIDAYTLSATLVYQPFVLRLQDNSYLMVYGKRVSSTYTLQKRTSADFLAWSAESALSISPFGTTLPFRHPFLLQLDGGDIWLLFERVDELGTGGYDLVNCYLSISTNNGATWGTAIAITSFSTRAVIGTHPTAVQKFDDRVWVSYVEERGALWMNHNTPGVCAGATGDAQARGVSFDAVNRKIYSFAESGGTPSCITQMDADTWTVDRSWSKSTTPAIPFAFTAEGGAATNIRWCHHNGHLLGAVQYGIEAMMVFDGRANTIRGFYLKDAPAQGVVKNVSGYYQHEDRGTPDVHRMFLDDVNNRCYALLRETYASTPHVEIGYIDLNDPGPEYTWHRLYLVADAGEWSGFDVYNIAAFHVVPENGYIFFSVGHSGGYAGRLTVLAFGIGTAGVVMDITGGSLAAIPRRGLLNITYYNGSLYGTFTYESGFGEENRRGLYELTMGGSASFHRPTYHNFDTSYFHTLCPSGDGKIIIAAGSTTSSDPRDGVAVFDTVDKSWVLMNGANVPGIKAAFTEVAFYAVAFDQEQQMVIAGSPYYREGTSYFPLSGKIRRWFYDIVENVPPWTVLEDPTLLARGLQESNGVMALDPESAVFGVWVRSDLGNDSIKWDTEQGSIELSPYLIAGTPISMKRTVDGSPSSLEFALSHGHFFDPSNQSSLLRIYLRKGRVLSLRFGDVVEGSNYWANQGKYYVTETRLGYDLGQYPIIRVSGKDRKVLWDDMEVLATDAYSAVYPDVILDDVLQTFAGVPSADIDLPPLAKRTPLYHQWLDSTVADIVDQLATRYGEFVRIDMDGKVSSRPISLAQEPHLIYDNLTRVFRYSPEDTFSNFINRVLAVGYERTFTDVIHSYERITSHNGTCGWWSGKERKRFWYSDDQTRKALYPKLQITETGKNSFLPVIGKSKIYIDREDTINKQWVEVVIEVDLQTDGLIAAIGGGAVVGGLLVLYWLMGDAVTAWGLGWTRPIGTFLSFLTLGGVMLILVQSSNYAFDLYARPLGKVQRAIQAVSDDLEFQQELGQVLEKKIEDELCYTYADCKTVADQELEVVKAQRRRVTLQKTADLRIEEGDVIRVIHPFSGLPVSLFVTDIERKMVISDGEDAGGTFEDSISGWRIETG